LKNVGAYYAEVLAKNGATVVVSERTSSLKRLKGVAGELTKKGKTALPFILDMTDFNNFDNKIHEIVKELGSIDILINNAAVSIDEEFFNISQDNWYIHMNTNLKGLFFLSQAEAKQVRTQQEGGNNKYCSN
jgi:NADP-dependent 3-hydroxy acid dehydrogenase YdfG